MKIDIIISKVEVERISSWPTMSERLVVSGDGVTFRVANTAVERKAYVIGRRVSITIKPGTTA